MVTVDPVAPTLDELIFAISQINYNTICRPSTPPSSTLDLLCDNIEKSAEPETQANPLIAETEDATEVVTDDSLTDLPGHTYEPKQSYGNKAENNRHEGSNAAADRPGVPRHSKMRRYQVLLDLIALLLVTEGKSDVAAASLSTHGPITFFYSKNRPLTPQETNYVRSLFEIASGSSRSTAERFEALLKLVLENCEKKIKARIQKVLRRVKQLRTVAQLGIRSESRLPWDVADYLRSQLQLQTTETLADFFPIWCDYLDNRDLYKDPQLLGYVVSTAYAMGHPTAMSHIMDERLLKRIRKVGDYIGGILTLTSELDKLKPAELQSMVIQEVGALVTGIRAI
jgi:hypothetical protein